MKKWLITLFLTLFGSLASGAGPAPKLVLQVSEGLDQADYAIQIATNYKKTNPAATIHVVAYSQGIDFLVDGSQRVDAVRKLQKAGVVFKVCNNTLRYRGLDKSRVLGEASIVPFGAIEIARLQQEEGFAYVKP
jgi:uncharacterized protein